MFFEKKSAAKTTSILLLVAAMLMAANVIFGLPISANRNVHLTISNFQTIEPTLYRFTKGSFERIGRVETKSSGLHVRIYNNLSGCDCVFAMSEPKFGQFLKMTNQDDWHRILGNSYHTNDAHETLKDMVRNIENESQRRFEKIILDAIVEVWASDAVKASKSTLVSYFGAKISPKVLQQLAGILADRVAVASVKVFEDAMARNGLDLIRGQVSLQPLESAVTQLLADPRITQSLNEILIETLNVPESRSAIRSFTREFINELVNHLVVSGSFETKEYRYFIENIMENLFAIAFPMGRNHPVLAALIRNELLLNLRPVDRVVIVLEREVAQVWFSADQIYEMKDAHLQ